MRGYGADETCQHALVDPAAVFFFVGGQLGEGTHSRIPTLKLKTSRIYPTRCFWGGPKSTLEKTSDLWGQKTGSAIFLDSEENLKISSLKNAKE